jgi:hypothetical protein
VNNIGGYIDVDETNGGTTNKRRIPLRCPASACAIKVDGMKLDYRTEFTLSSLKTHQTDSAIITTGSTHPAGFATVVTQATVSASDLCKTDGTLLACDSPMLCKDAANGLNDIDESETTLQDWIDELNGYANVADTGLTYATFYVTKHVGVVYNAYTSMGNANLDFCESSKHEISISTKQGQLTSTLTVSELDDFSFKAQFVDLGFEACEISAGVDGHRVYVDIDVSSVNELTVDLFSVSSDSPLEMSPELSNNGLLQFKTECLDVCASPLLTEYLGLEHVINVDVASGSGSVSSQRTASTFQITTQLLGLPISCDGALDTVSHLPLVELRTYPKEVDSDGSLKSCAESDSTVTIGALRAGTDTACFKLGDFTATGSTWDLNIDSVETVLTGFDGIGVDASGFSTMIPVTTDGTVRADAHVPGSYAPTVYHAGATYTVIVDFSEPVDNGARRLRATYKFGVGEGHTEGSVVVLPAEVQVHEQLESDDSDKEEVEPGATEQAEQAEEAEEAEHESGSTTIDNTTIYIGVSLIVTGAAVWVLTMTKCCSAKLHCCAGSGAGSDHSTAGGRVDGARAYKKLKTFERFSSNIAF